MQESKEITREQQIEKLTSARIKLHRLSTLLDDAFTIPGTSIRIGWDGLIGLIPVVGDFLGAFLSLFIVVQGIRLKVPKLVLIRMLCNIAVELLAGMIPILGDLFDISWRANKKNYALIERHIYQELQDQELQAFGTHQALPSTTEPISEQIPLLLVGLILAALIILIIFKLNTGNLLTLDQLTKIVSEYSSASFDTH